MVDLHQTVCCMCGDVGFADKLFRCSKCLHRFQHSYCSNYYRELSERSIEVCDWCQSEERNNNNARQASSSKKSEAAGHDIRGGVTNQSENSGDKIKQQDKEDQTAAEKGKSSSGVPSPRTATRSRVYERRAVIGNNELNLYDIFGVLSFLRRIECSWVPFSQRIEFIVPEPAKPFYRFNKSL